MTQQHSTQHQSHDHDFDPAEAVTQAFWDTRYASADQIWSGNPNQRLVEQVADLTPGSALEVGCGEGADAIWLAGRGWQVTGVDVSTVALERAAQQAAATGPEIAARIAWQQADILAWAPPARQFDLVTSHFIHVASADREALHRRLAAGVRPGGTLLIVGHHPSDLETTAGRWRMRDFLFTAEQVAAVLGPSEWEILVCAAPARDATDPEGRPITIHDAVLKARRRP
jgi:2-polyprenyl-3-methyl-5-hydroxy-6-metoxy-1,4-benzoquinol methylase